MIKSVLIISRALPAYKLSRRQGPETFVVMYRPFLGECCSTAAVLGEGFQSCQVRKIIKQIKYRATHLVSDPGWVDLDLRSSQYPRQITCFIGV